MLYLPLQDLEVSFELEISEIVWWEAQVTKIVPVRNTHGVLMTDYLTYNTSCAVQSPANTHGTISWMLAGDWFRHICWRWYCTGEKTLGPEVRWRETVVEDV